MKKTYQTPERKTYQAFSDRDSGMNFQRKDMQRSSDFSRDTQRSDFGKTRSSDYSRDSPRNENRTDDNRGFNRDRGFGNNFSRNDRVGNDRPFGKRDGRAFGNDDYKKGKIYYLEHYLDMRNIKQIQEVYKYF